MDFWNVRDLNVRDLAEFWVLYDVEIVEEELFVQLLVANDLGIVLEVNILTAYEVKLNLYF